MSRVTVLDSECSSRDCESRGTRTYPLCDLFAVRGFVGQDGVRLRVSAPPART